MITGSRRVRGAPRARGREAGSAARLRSSGVSGRSASSKRRHDQRDGRELRRVGLQDICGRSVSKRMEETPGKCRREVQEGET